MALITKMQYIFEMENSSLFYSSLEFGILIAQVH